MTDPSALISIVIRTHDRPAEMVAEAARSVLVQDDQGDFELIVAHSGPERERLDGVIDGLPDAPGCRRIRRVDAQQAAGNRAAMCNVGVREARGEWVRFVDDDDLLAPAALAVYRDRLAATGGEAPIVWCDLIWESRNRRGRPYYALRLNSDIARRARNRAERALLTHVGTATLFARRSLLVSNPYSEDYHAAEDAEWLWRTALGCGTRMDFVPAILTRARIHGANTAVLIGAAEIARLQRRAAEAVSSSLRADGRAAEADLFEEALRRRDSPGRLSLRTRASNTCSRSRHLTRLYLSMHGVRDGFGMF